jgi:hypothetical protein
MAHSLLSLLPRIVEVKCKRQKRGGLGFFCGISVANEEHKLGYPRS